MRRGACRSMRMRRGSTVALHLLCHAHWCWRWRRRWRRLWRRSWRRMWKKWRLQPLTDATHKVPYDVEVGHRCWPSKTRLVCPKGGWVIDVREWRHAPWICSPLHSHVHLLRDARRVRVAMQWECLRIEDLVPISVSDRVQANLQGFAICRSAMVATFAFGIDQCPTTNLMACKKVIDVRANEIREVVLHIDCDNGEWIGAICPMFELLVAAGIFQQIIQCHVLPWLIVVVLHAFAHVIASHRVPSRCHNGNVVRFRKGACQHHCSLHDDRKNGAMA